MNPLAEQVNSAGRMTYERAASALFGDYSRVFVVRDSSGRYTEYAVNGDRTLSAVASGTDFYADLRHYAAREIWHEDRGRVLKMLDHERLSELLSGGCSVAVNYRITEGDGVLYHALKVTKGYGSDSGLVFFGVRRIGRHMRRYAAAAVNHELYSQIAGALARSYEVIYIVNVVTGSYMEYSASESYARLNVSRGGTDFFGDTQKNLKTDIFEADYRMMAQSMERETLLKNLDENGSVTLTYRLLLDGAPQFVTLTAIRQEDDPEQLIIAVANIDASKRRELAYREALGSALDLAHRDALTGAGSKYAYVQTESELDERIAKGGETAFAVAVCDINGLKRINDTEGHRSGDAFIRDACRMITAVFRKSRVFRVGGDEFAVLLLDKEYEKREALLAELKNMQETQKAAQLVTVACGMADFIQGNDCRVQDVFERADRAMYENKKLFRQ